MTGYTHHHWEINSKHTLLNIKTRDMWDYRDLVGILVRRDFIAIYKQTILGPLWYIIQPLLTTIIYTVVFGRIAKISTNGLPGPLFYMAGITIWNFFTDCFLKTSGVFRDNAGVFGKVYFPRLIVPLSNIIGNVLRFGIQLLLFFSFVVYYLSKGVIIHPNIYLLLFPVLILITAMLGLGIGMIVSALTTKYRDLTFLVSFGIQLLMYATTVIYPLSSAPNKYKTLITLNPMTAVIETFRYSLFGSGSFTWKLLLYSVLLACCFVFVGLIVFTKVEKNFIDTV